MKLDVAYWQRRYEQAYWYWEQAHKARKNCELLQNHATAPAVEEYWAGHRAHWALREQIAKMDCDRLAADIKEMVGPIPA